MDKPQTLNYYHQIGYMREQGQPMGKPQVPNYAPQSRKPKKNSNERVERAQFVLRNQPPLLGVAVERFLQPKDITHDEALVPIICNKLVPRDPNHYSQVHKPSNLKHLIKLHII